MIKKISIVGGGEIGQAISFIVSSVGESCSIWDKNPEKSSALSPAECFEDATAVFFCVPSFVLRSVLIELVSFLPPDIPVVFVSKGMEQGTGFSAPEMASEFLDLNRIVFMGGPMIAEEIIAGKGGRAVLGGEQESANIIAKIFKGRYISAEIAENAFSVAILGVLKNVYSLVLGAAASQGLGENMKAYLVAKSIREMDVIARILGGTISVMSTAGIGDFVATSMSCDSSNQKAGFKLVSGYQPDKLSEGISSISALVERILKNVKSDELEKFSILSFAQAMVEREPINQESWNKILND